MKDCKCWDCKHLGKCQNASGSITQCEKFDEFLFNIPLKDIARFSEVSYNVFRNYFGKITRALKNYYEKTGVVLHITCVNADGTKGQLYMCCEDTYIEGGENEII